MLRQLGLEVRYRKGMLRGNYIPNLKLSSDGMKLERNKPCSPLTQEEEGLNASAALRAITGEEI